MNAAIRSAVQSYIRTRLGKGVSVDVIREEIRLVLGGVRDHRIPDDAIVILDVL